MALEIKDYALIGDCKTAALVGKNGSIDWLCLPRFDSAACFAALLGGPEHGHWQIRPHDPTESVRRRYRADTLVLETEFETASGSCRLTDFMPIGRPNPAVVRIISGLKGQVGLRMELVIRFDYGRRVPWVHRTNGELAASAGPDLLVLRTPAKHNGEDLKTVAEFTVTAGQDIPFIMACAPSHREMPAPLDAQEALQQTENFWRQWAAQCAYRGPWREAVIRSLITLKALTYEPSGGIIAAPTTSLPELTGGSRNWDYRFCWLRDATFVLLSFMHAGYRREAEAWRAWLTRTIAGSPSELQPIYGLRGKQRIDEWQVAWLPGYEGAKPVRIGNSAYAQLQIDTFGEVLDAMHHARRHHLACDDSGWPLQKALLKYIETLRDTPDRSIWEFRGAPQHFTYSKVMMWVAFDRAIAAVEQFGLDGPADHWRRLRSALHAEICAKAFDAELGSFVQSYGSKQLDAATLLIPLVGFLPANHARMLGTVEAIRKHLMHDDYLVRRYDQHHSEDGLPPGEGFFLACSFWLADNLVLQGRHSEARRIFERLLDLRNDTGLLAEQFDARTNSFLGNFPQALSHLALVNTAYNLTEPHGPARQRSQHSREKRNLDHFTPDC